ncbi:hypothetical protein DY000_02061497 [Brassica cretica]|uniref:Cytochrome P450 n=1 Tax=Brassica cretica TaxID=69181 RepID=A0ABQ7AY18_BRACR|nr:hypothetical protein DY000_02061497 [Brassica cretica]
MEFLIIIFFLVSLPIFIFFIFPRKPSSHIGFKSYPIVGSLPGLVKNRHRFLDWTVEILSGCPTQAAVFRRPGNRQFVMTANPANVEFMLKTKFDSFPKGERFISLLEDLLGRGIFNSDGKMWWKQRKTASYEFSTRSLRDFVMTNATVEINTRSSFSHNSLFNHTTCSSLFTKACSSPKLITVARLSSPPPKARRCHHRSSSSTTHTKKRREDEEDPAKVRDGGESVTKVGGRHMVARVEMDSRWWHRQLEATKPFNVDAACLGDGGADGVEFMRAFDTAATIISERFQSVTPYSWKIKKKLDIVSQKLLRESIVTVHKFADGIVRHTIDQARSSNNMNEDLLSRFINIEEMNSPELLRDIVISFILAGRDTTSSALSWFFWLLSKHPEVENKIIQELNSVRERTGKRIGEVYGYEELKLMNYLHAAITESLRLYPPVPVEIMSCVEDNLLPDGTFVGKSWGTSYNAYAMGRMESIWGKGCDRFDPARWIDETNGGFRGENPYKFPVFHAGLRMCLGKEMAYIQMKSIVAAVLDRFVVEVPGKKERPEILLSMTLRIKGGLFVRIHERT